MANGLQHCRFWAIQLVLAHARAMLPADQGKGGGDHVRHAAKMSQSEREGQRKVARLALDTSAHGGVEYQKLRSQLASGVRSAPAGPRSRVEDRQDKTSDLRHGRVAVLCMSTL